MVELSFGMRKSLIQSLALSDQNSSKADDRHEVLSYLIGINESNFSLLPHEGKKFQPVIRLNILAKSLKYKLLK